MSTRTERHSYDSLGRFAIEEENTLGQVTQRINSWDAFGNPLVSNNIDGVETTSAADLMGRPFISYTETGAWSKSINYTGRGNYCPTGTAFRTLLQVVVLQFKPGVSINWDGTSVPLSGVLTVAIPTPISTMTNQTA